MVFYYSTSTTVYSVLYITLPIENDHVLLFQTPESIGGMYMTSNVIKVPHDLVVFKSHISHPVDVTFPVAKNCLCILLNAPNRILEV